MKYRHTNLVEDPASCRTSSPRAKPGKITNDDLKDRGGGGKLTKKKKGLEIGYEDEDKDDVGNQY
jgi:hypothetical protein